MGNSKACRFNHEYIGTEHILLGLIRLGEGVAAAILQKCDISTDRMREFVERVVQHGPGGVGGRLPHTPQADVALRWAYEEARFLEHNFVCTERLLMGLLHNTDSVVAVVLDAFGLTADRARDEAIKLSPPGRGAGGHSAGTP